MKILKDGKLKLSKDDYRVGNFVYTVEKEHIKVQDIGSVFSHRVSLASAKGEMLLVFIRSKSDKALMNYAAVMYNILGLVPDNQYLEEVNRLTIECMERHKDLYGIREDISEEENQEIIEEQKKVNEAIEALKEGAE